MASAFYMSDFWDILTSGFKEGVRLGTFRYVALERVVRGNFVSPHFPNGL